MGNEIFFAKKIEHMYYFYKAIANSSGATIDPEYFSFSIHKGDLS